MSHSPLASEGFPPMTDDKLIERLRATYTVWNNPPSDGLPEGAGVLLEAADALAAKDTALSEMRVELEEANADRCFASDDDPACKLEHKFNQIAEAERKRRLTAEAELDRVRTEAAAQFKRDGEKLTEADRRAEALADCLDCARLDWEGNNGEIIDKTDPHWTVEARRLIATRAPSIQETDNG